MQVMGTEVAENDLKSRSASASASFPVPQLSCQIQSVYGCDQASNREKSVPLRQQDTVICYKATLDLITTQNAGHLPPWERLTSCESPYMPESQHRH